MNVLPWTSSGANRLASLTDTGAISSMEIDGMLLTILISGAGCYGQGDEQDVQNKTRNRPMFSIDNDQTSSIMNIPL